MNLPTITYAPSSPMADSVQTIQWQDDAVNDIIERLDKRGKKQYRGIILRGSTGLGKMYITAKAIRTMHDLRMLHVPEGSMNPFPVLWLCPKTLKVQTQRCLKEHGIAHLVMVMSYGQIKNKDGTSLFLKYETRILPNGQPSINTVWNPAMRFALVVCDEMQKHKNWDSLISNVIVNIPEDMLYIGMSATPGQRVDDFKVAMVRCGVVTKYNSLPCSAKVAPALAREIAAPKHPSEYSPSTMERLREALDDYIVELKNVRFKFPTKTQVVKIQFKSAAERAAYIKAYEDYLRELWELKKIRKSHYGIIQRWVANQKFQQKAEFIRCGEIAERSIQRIKEGKQVIVASNYVETLRQIWRILRQMGFDENRISFIVGGRTETQNQEQVDKFQEGRSDIMLFTMKAGGVGLSMHHDRTSTRPRHIILPFCWSAIDFVQALGRGHRLTSLSPTTQEILAYANTIEDRVGDVLQLKVKCISKSITAKEQFMTMFDKRADDDIKDIDKEESDELAEVITEEELKQKGEVDADTSEEDITGEGLESDDSVEFPTTYR